MPLADILEQAQGGAFFANAGRLVGLAPEAARTAMQRLAPAIATALQRHMRNAAAYDALLDIIEDGEGDAFLDDPEALKDPEVLADGEAILKDVYGGRSKVLKAGHAALVGDIPDNALRKLMAIAACAVLAALVRANRRPMAAAQAAEPDGSGLLGTILTAVVEGVVKGAAKSLASRSRRPYTARMRRKSTRRRTTRPSLESVFGELIEQAIRGR